MRIKSRLIEITKKIYDYQLQMRIKPRLTDINQKNYTANKIKQELN